MTRSSIQQWFTAVLRACLLVLKRPAYLAIAVIVSLVILFFATWLPNVSLLRTALVSDTVSLAVLLKGSIGFFSANIYGARAVVVVAVAVLSGIDSALVVYYFRHRMQAERGAGIGILGTIVGMLGIGCAACGSVIISSIFGLGATASVVGLLPFRGIEFGIIGIVVLLVAIYLVARKIINPTKCQTNNH